MIEYDLKNKLTHYLWPGNVRELENCAKFTAAMSNSEKLELSNLPDSIQTALKKDIPEQLVSEELKKITLALTQNSSNKTKAARQLGISRMTLWRKMKAFNL
jgi:transcriptional regulator of acetoin/glycerol metabolism